MRAYPEPAIMLMHGDLSAVKPTWGPCGMWRWFTWAALNPADGSYRWDTINDYLKACAAQGRKAAISVLLCPDINQDTTPAWVYGPSTQHGMPSSGQGGKGWPIKDGPYAGGTFPKWNDGTWDAAYAKFIKAFGERFNGDPRLHSVWLTFARYGETVTDGLGSDLHNPGRYFANVINWYDAAFPTTPLCALITGPTDRLTLANLCWEKHIVVKFNALVKDSPTHVQLRPTAGAGHAEIAHKAMSLGAPTAWEHYYPPNQNETYWALLTFLALGGTVLDLPAVYLDALAASGLWDWALEVMLMNQERVGLYVARDTIYPPPGNGWEHGYPGPWERNITTNATCSAPNSAGWKAAPTTLTSTLEGYGGIGYATPDLTITSTLPEGEYHVEVTYAPESDADNWHSYFLTTTLPGTFTVATEPCWVHSVTALPVVVEPEPPEPSVDLAELSERVDTCLTRVQDADMDIVRHDAMIESLDMVQETHAAKLAELDQHINTVSEQVQAIDADQVTHESKLAELEAEIAQLLSRVLELEDAREAVREALA